MRGRLTAIWLKRVRRGPMDPVDRAELREAHGLVGNANVGGKRQVTILEREAWDRHMTALGASLDPATRRANLMIEGVSLVESRGRVLRIGNARIRIHGETRPCEQMEESLPGLRQAMSEPYGGGAFGEVLTSGPIRIGDVVAWELDA